MTPATPPREIPAPRDQTLYGVKPPRPWPAPPTRRDVAVEEYRRRRAKGLQAGWNYELGPHPESQDALRAQAREGDREARWARQAVDRRMVGRVERLEVAATAVIATTLAGVALLLLGSC